MTQGSKRSGLWAVLSTDGGEAVLVARDLDLRQASELVWRLMKGLD